MKLRNGCTSFKLPNNQFIVTSDFVVFQVARDLQVLPTQLSTLPSDLIKKLKMVGILIEENKELPIPPYKTQLLLEHITFKNLEIGRVPFIFQEVVKNSSFSPVFTIDCSFQVTDVLLGLIRRKYKENCINPILKIRINEDLELFQDLIENHLENYESIEWSNLILILDSKYEEESIIADLKQRLQPLEIYISYESPSLLVTKEERQSVPKDYKILLQLNEELLELHDNYWNREEICVDDDSIFRCLTILRKSLLLNLMESTTITYIPPYLQKYSFKPYCGACDTKLCIEGDGQLYPCELGYEKGDLITTLEDRPLRELLKSKSFQQYRQRIEQQSITCQRTCCLAQLCSGCLYQKQKCSLIMKILKAWLGKVEIP
ncbi:MAG: hypothetical protein ACTSRS_19710 [Candidatus Helarchaeota archaeon]